jgi:hypothetical protein
MLASANVALETIQPAIPPLRRKRYAGGRSVPDASRLDVAAVASVYGCASADPHEQVVDDDDSVTGQ